MKGTLIKYLWQCTVSFLYCCLYLNLIHSFSLGKVISRNVSFTKDSYSWQRCSLEFCLHRTKNKNQDKQKVFTSENTEQMSIHTLETVQSVRRSCCPYRLSKKYFYYKGEIRTIDTMRVIKYKILNNYKRFSENSIVCIKIYICK